MGARVHIELAEEFPEDERGTLPGRLRLTDVPEHHHENCDIECHEDGECAGRVSGFIRGDDDDVTGHGPSDRQDVQPGACATLFVLGHNVRDKARVGTCDPVPPKLQEDERRRVEPEARAGAERKQQQEADAAAEDPRDQEKPASSVPVLRAVRKGATTSATTAPAARMVPLIASLAALSPPRMTAT